MAHIIKVTIEDTHPPVWRRICVPDGITFADLHRTIQAAFGWEEEHLHDFTFADRTIVIGPRGDDIYRDLIPENTAVIDEFLKECKWIRYTYDFGDNWTHKIVFEKTYDNWDKRYPALIKAKGDNYHEDCGGIWNATDSDRFPLDIEAVNAHYASWNIKPVKNGREAQNAIARIKDVAKRKEERRRSMQELRQLFEQMMKEWDYTHDHMRQENKAAQLRQQNANTLANRMQENQTQYERELEAVRLGKSRQGVINCSVLAPEKSVKEMIYASSTEALRDLCNYMALGASDDEAKTDCKSHIIHGDIDMSDHDKYAALMYDLIESSPWETLIAFSKDDIHELKKLYKVPSGRSIEVKDAKVLTNASVCGLLDFKVKARDKKNGTFASVRWANDAGLFLDRLTDEVIDAHRNRITRTLDKMTDMVAIYGIIGRDPFYELYRKTYSEGIDKRTFERYINAMDFPGNVVRVVIADDGTEYVANDTQNVERIFSDMSKYGADNIPYKIFSPEELTGSRDMIRWNNESYKNFSEGMQSLFEMTDHQLDIWSEAIYLDVQEGECPDEIYLEVLKGFEAEDVLGRLSIWEYVMEIAITSPMAALHGNARIDYAMDKKINIWTMFSHHEDAVDASLSDTIFDIPYEEQGMVLEIVKTAYPDKHMIKQLKDIINAHSDKNYDLRSLLARAYLNNQDIKEAERIYRQLAKESEDESLVGIYKEIRSIAREYRGNPEYSDISLMNNREFEELSLDDWRPQEIITVKRDKPKVGRNDPCPCGSGKKYKKCCMGKGIY